VECSGCQKRYRLDNLLSPNEFANFLEQKSPKNYPLTKSCLTCHKGKFTVPRRFNLLLATDLATTEKSINRAYLRPETCQAIFTNFSAVRHSARRQLPFGIGQIGKSFRNEITFHHGVFRTREFEQMELEFFCETAEREK
jgi:glycyl-tRNA synthetase